MPGQSRPAARRQGPIAWLAIVATLSLAALGLGACSGTASDIPSLATPTTPLPSLVIPTGGSPIAACVDGATYAVIQELKAPNADVSTLLTANKDTLVTGLQKLQPADAATTTWRDALLAALQAGDMTTAATQVAMLANSQITLTSC